MRHLRKTKDKFSETKGYLLAVGILIKALDIIKSVLILMWVHSNGIIAARNKGDIRMMSKIEYRLTDINFHSECTMMTRGNYEELIKMCERGQIK